MTHCQRCDKTVHPVHELHESGRILPCCPTCSAPLIEAAQPVQQAAAPLKVAAVAKPVALAIGDDDDLVDMMKRELAKVEEEIVHLQKRQAYAEKLRRMIAAAEPDFIELRNQ